MIRYSAYSATNFQSPSSQTYLDPLELQYRELLELRERVRKGEAAAAAARRKKTSLLEPNPRHAQYCQRAAELGLGSSERLQ